MHKTDNKSRGKMLRIFKENIMLQNNDNNNKKSKYIIVNCLFLSKSYMQVI